MTSAPGAPATDARGIVPVDVVLATVAKIVCSGIFISGRSLEDLSSNAVPHAFKIHHVDPTLQNALDVSVDAAAQRVQISALLDSSSASSLVEAYRQTFPDLHADWKAEVERIKEPRRHTQAAQYVGDQGCVILPPSGDIFFEPTHVSSGVADPAGLESSSDGGVTPMESGAGYRGVARAVDAAFTPGSPTAAVVVVHRGRLVAERYLDGFDRNTRLESWSMGKSVVATLIGRLVHDGHLTLDEPAPVPEWKADASAYSSITVRHLLNMSSGLDFAGDADPRTSWRYGTSDHFYIYGAPVDTYTFATASRPRHTPGTVGKYLNCDPLILCRIAKHIVTNKLHEDFTTWPQRTLLERIEITQHLLETDCYGNFVMTGFVYGTARDWARLGELYLADGVWNGERLLPEGWSEFVSTPAPGWASNEYGALFWLNRNAEYDLPEDTYYMNGYGEQCVFIVPSADLVIVHMGLAGQESRKDILNRTLGAVMRELPK